MRSGGGRGQSGGSGTTNDDGPSRSGDETTSARREAGPGEAVPAGTPGGEDADGTPARRSAIPRRDLLRTLGVAGAGSVLGGTAVSGVSAQSGFDEAAADQRIRETQMGPLTVEAVDANGNPLSGANVSVEMQEHDFVFGTAVGGDPLINQYGDDHPYRQNLLELFNTAVLGNDHKWAFFENNQALADAAVDWLESNGFRIRGHTCVYGVDYAIPGDVQTAIENEDAQTIRQRSMQHIEDIITHYGDRVQEWDVVNEAMHRGLIQSGVYPDGINLDDLPAGSVQPWRSQLLADWFAKAEEVIDQNGLDVDVVTNDYNTMTWSYARSRYADQLSFLQNQGIGVDGIGLQSHIGPTMGDGSAWTYANINGVFDHYAQFDTNIRITEYDMAGEDWNGHQQRANVMRRFLKTAFGHPNVDEFMIWGMWDQTHWLDEAAFFEEDWTAKPAVDVWRNLVQDEWWTSASGSTDGSGTFGVDATLGTHQVSVTAGGQTVTREVSVTDANAGATVQVQVPVDAGTPTPCEPATITPYVRVDGGTWQNTSSVSIQSGSSVEFGPQPTSGGSWSWSGPGLSGSSREVTVSPSSTGTTTYTATYTNDCGATSTQSFTVTVESTLPTAPSPVAGTTPQDSDGDGVYEDFNGNGEFDSDDVVRYFQHIDDSAVQNNPSYYDANGNGNADFDDIVTLFQQL